MLIQVEMPKFGLSMEFGTIDEWTVELGQKVAKGDILAEVSTDKITNSVLSPGDGYIRKFVADEGDTIDCGELIAIMTDTADEEFSLPEAGAKAPEAAEETAPPPPATAEVVAESGAETVFPETDVKITPRAKKIAEDKNLSYGHIKGTGRLGAVTVDDLKKYGRPRTAQAAPAAPVVPAAPAAPAAPVVPAAVIAAPPPVVAPVLPAADSEVVRKLTNIEKMTARTMHASLAGTAQATIMTDAEMSGLVPVYRELKNRYAQAGVRLTYTALIVKAVAMALEEHPKMRASLLDEDHVQISNRISIGVAVDLPDDNLIVPVIRDANMMDLRSIALKLGDLTERAKNNALQVDELGNATLTISNMGTLGISYFTPVLNPPEGALLGVGAMRDQIVVEGGTMKIAPVMNLSLTHDHRIINGGPAARFLMKVVHSLQNFGWM